MDENTPVVADVLCVDDEEIDDAEGPLKREYEVNGVSAADVAAAVGVNVAKEEEAPKTEEAMAEVCSREGCWVEETEETETL